MLELWKLERMLDEAMARESAESLAAWLDEERRKDEEAGIYRFDGLDELAVEEVPAREIRYDSPHTKISDSLHVPDGVGEIVFAA